MTRSSSHFAVVVLRLVFAAAATAAAADDHPPPLPSGGDAEAILPPDVPPAACRSSLPPSHSSMYHRRSSPGGTSAQAYKPGAPASNVVCDQDDASDEDEEEEGRRYLVAGRPLFRRSTYGGGKAPRVEFVGRLWRSCSSSSSDDNEEGVGEECAAAPLSEEDLSAVSVEVWQPRLDGTYSSLAPGRDEGECRSTLVLDDRDGYSSSFHFVTSAPGSTGSLGGLGPSGLDFPPYGPPAIHLLIRAPGRYETLLASVVVMPPSQEKGEGAGVGTTTRTATAATFRGPDLRGPALVLGGGGGGGGGGGDTAEVATTRVTFRRDEREDDGEGRNIAIEVEADFCLTPWKGGKEEEDEGPLPSLEEELCRSWLPGLSPWSFFTEPMAVCAPYLLDYFDL